MCNRINMKSKTAETLVAKETSVDGRRLNFFNSVAVARDGAVYYSNESRIMNLYSSQL